MSKGKVLLVEDAYINQVLVENILIDAGFDVLIVDDGEKAIEALQNDTFILMILDLMMPVMDGFTLLEKAKDKINFPVIVVTARSDYESIEKAIHLGANDYLIKPFNSKDFLNKVERLLAK